MIPSILDSINANSIILVAGFIAAFIVQRNSVTGKVDRETAQSYKDLSDAKDKEILQMKQDHDKEIAQMQSDIKAMAVQINALQQQNGILRELVTGKDALDHIEKILEPIPKLFMPGGFMETVAENQDKVLKDLSDIRLIIDPKEKNPPKRTFSHRPHTPLATA